MNDDKPEFESCVRYDTARLDFNAYFMSWIVVMNFGQDYTCAFLCMGWEL